MTLKWKSLDQDYVVKEYLSGRSAADIGNDFGIGNKPIYRVLQERNIQLRPSGTTRPPFDESEAVRLYNSGIGLRGISERLGVSVTPIRTFFVKRGTPLRNRSAQQQARMDRSSPEERLALAAKAHDAVRGSTRSFETLCQQAQTRMRTVGVRTSPAEFELQAMLRERGIETIHQTAIGPYNCDLGAYPVAVEVYGGNWHWHGEHLRRTEERFRYILNAGWHIICVAIGHRYPMGPPVADYLASYINEVRSNPPSLCEYRVVWSAGERVIAGRSDTVNFSIERPLHDGFHWCS